MVIKRPVVRTVHEITILERRVCQIFETVCGIAQAEFTLITTTVERTAGLLQRLGVLKCCAVVTATVASNHMVHDALRGQVDDPDVYGIVGFPIVIHLLEYMWFLKKGHESTVHHDTWVSLGLEREIFDLLLGLLFLLLIPPPDSLIVKACNDNHKPFGSSEYHARANTGPLNERGHVFVI